MSDVTLANTHDKVAFREKILGAQERMLELVAENAAVDAIPSCTLTHTYTPIH